MKTVSPDSICRNQKIMFHLGKYILLGTCAFVRNTNRFIFGQGPAQPILGDLYVRQPGMMARGLLRGLVRQLVFAPLASREICDSRRAD